MSSTHTVEYISSAHHVSIIYNAQNSKRVRKWCQCYSTLKGQTRVYACGQPLSVDLDHRVSGSQYLGVAPEEGAYSRDKMSGPAYKTPLRFRLALSLQKGCAFFTAVHVVTCERSKINPYT